MLVLNFIVQNLGLLSVFNTATKHWVDFSWIQNGSAWNSLRHAIEKVSKLSNF